MMTAVSSPTFPIPLSIGPSSHRLYLPKSQNSRIESHIRTTAGGQKPGEIDNFPFARKVDVWFAAICWAVNNGLAPVQHDTTGGFVSLGPNTQDIRTSRWQEELLSVAAVDYFGVDEVEKYTDPKEIVDLANGLAASGTGPLLDAIEPFIAMGYPALAGVVMMYSEKLSDDDAES